MSEDAQEAYDKAVIAIDESAEKQEEIVNQMLANISKSYDDTYTGIAGTIDDFNKTITDSSKNSISSIESYFKNFLNNMGLNFNFSLNDILTKLQSSTGNVQITTDNQINIFDNALDTIKTKYGDTFEKIKQMLNEFNKKVAEDTNRNIEQINQSASNTSIPSSITSSNSNNSPFTPTSNAGSMTNEVTINSSNTILGDNLSNAIKVAKKAGFAKGGVIGSSFTPLNSIFDVVKQNGDNSLVIGARAGESIMTEQFTSMIPTLLKNMDLFNGAFEDIKNMNFGSYMSTMSVPDIHFDNLINIQGNVDKNSLEELKKYSEKMYQEIIDRITQLFKKELRKMK